MNPIFLNLNKGLHGSIISTPKGGFVLSIFHKPTGKSLYGFEHSLAAAHSWMDGAKLIFAEAEGDA